jgi:hypothetical protein
MREHVHWGFFNVIFAGASALVVFNVLRLVAVWAEDKPQLEWLSHTLGGALNFGVVSTRNEVSN